jgi:hypothetical protein
MGPFEASLSAALEPSPRSENPVHWEPLDSPYTQAKKAVYKLLVKVRAAIILLYAAWFMKPSHFRPESDSIYKNLGWGLPFIPGSIYAWGAQGFFGPLYQGLYQTAFAPVLEHDLLPYFSTIFSTIVFMMNNIIIAAMIFFGALAAFGFHWAMCHVGRIFGERESQPPYEFFLVRSASALMWFSVAVCLMAVPVLAQRPDLIGHLAAGALAVPLIWMVLFLVTGLSWMGMGTWMKTRDGGRVGLKEMYESDRFVKFVSRTQLTLCLLCIAGTFYLARHPALLVSL